MTYDTQFMVRQIALDTETTGKNDDGSPGEHRIIEVGCVEIVNRRITGRTLRLLINPERPVDPEAQRVHGMSWEMLKQEPTFAEVGQEIIDFIRGAQLLIHNAKFDTAFLDKEWALMGLNERTADMCDIVDTVALARKIDPNRQANLDNLCRIYEVDNSHRTQHGALLDAQLLAEVFLAMTGGQAELTFEEQHRSAAAVRHWQRPQGCRLPLMPVERPRHLKHVKTIAKLAQGHKIGQSADDSVQLAGSDWSGEYEMPLLVKGKEEGKKEYAARLKAQLEQKLSEMLSAEDLKVLAEVEAQEQAAQKAWEARVNQQEPKNPAA